MTYKQMLEDKLEEITFSISQLENERRGVEGKLNDIRVNKNIQEFEISIEKIELYDSDDKPFFGHVSQFQEWMVENNVTKPFYTWCGSVHLTDDLMNGRMGENICHIEDIVKQ